jgi:hypothetical protein
VLIVGALAFRLWVRLVAYEVANVVGRAGEEKARLEKDNGAAEAYLARLSSRPRVETYARHVLGLEYAQPSQYIRLDRFSPVRPLKIPDGTHPTGSTVVQDFKDTVRRRDEQG